MSRNRYSYTIVDAETGKVECTGLHNKEVANILGIEQGNISWYVINHRPYKGKYIDATLIGTVGKVAKPVKPKLQPIKIEGFDEKWDKYRFMVNPKARTGK